MTSPDSPPIDCRAVLVLGGARSGKSRYAQALAEGSRPRRLFLATAEAGDDEMADRIARHRSDRGDGWCTREEPLELTTALRAEAAADRIVLVDCLTLWLSNLFWEHRGAAPKDVEDAARTALERIAAAARDRQIIVVSNELGCGTVPEPAVTRAFRDTQGLLNQWAADAADEVILTVAGLPLHLKTAPQRKDSI